MDLDLHISLKPYRTRIEIACDPETRLDDFERQRLQRQLHQIIDRSVGEKWLLNEPDGLQAETSTGIFENRWLPLCTSTGLLRLQPEQILERYPAQPFEKLFLIVIEPAGIGYRISGREFDYYSQRLSPLAEKVTYETRFLAETVFHLLSDLFSSIVSIETVDGEQVTVSEQAGQFPTPDPDVATVEINSFFLPFFRYLNRDREVKNIQMIPWTYLEIEKMDRKHATCSVTSGLRGILSGSRRRVETLALHVQPRYQATELSLVPRGTSTQTYAGMKVQLSPLNPQEVRQLQIAAKKESEETKKPPKEPDYLTGEFLTNRSGTIEIDADPQQPLIWLYIRSGKALVANVPYLPGIDSRISIQIPDDRIRLGVEGELAVLNGELIESVAELSMKMSRIRKWAKSNEWDKVDAGIRGLESELSPRRIFLDKLNVIRVSAVEAAQAQNNRAAQARIASLCRETGNRIDRFLSPTGIIDLKAEIQDLKQLSGKNSKR
ncbi:hypothetical protein [Gimesia algae]|uniref:hypothetical protein n=1 Tax=Gimesia algae TaxID=2527971 RepID=UPI00119DFBFD|nr:hypothetical protein [Gimesia algae]